MSNPTTPTAPDPAVVEQAITEAQTQLSRVDTKASILFGLSLGMLTAGAAGGSRLHWHGIAIAGAFLTGILIGIAVLLLGTAIRPSLHGNYGFVRWASAHSVEALADQLRTTDPANTRIEQLWLISRSVRFKYDRVASATTVLGLALACAALTAFLAALGW